MDKQQALKVLISAAQTATKRWAFELAEAKVIAEAVEVFVEQPKEEEKKDKEEKEKKK